MIKFLHVWFSDIINKKFTSSKQHRFIYAMGTTQNWFQLCMEKKINEQYMKKKLDRCLGSKRTLIRLLQWVQTIIYVAL